jgi:Cu/Ag efflux protein CusF
MTLPMPVLRRTALGAAALCAALLAAPPAALAQTAQTAQTAHSGHGSHGADAGAAKESDFVDAEVRRVDAARQRVTLRHGEIAALDMSPMTMVFAVADPKWLETLKTGDRVQVKISQRGSTYTVTALRPAP